MNTPIKGDGDHKRLFSDIKHLTLKFSEQIRLFKIQGERVRALVQAHEQHILESKTTKASAPFEALLKEVSELIHRYEQHINEGQTISATMVKQIQEAKAKLIDSSQTLHQQLDQQALDVDTQQDDVADPSAVRDTNLMSPHEALISASFPSDSDQTSASEQEPLHVDVAKPTPPAAAHKSAEVSVATGSRVWRAVLAVIVVVGVAVMLVDFTPMTASFTSHATGTPRIPSIYRGLGSSPVVVQSETSTQAASYIPSPPKQPPTYVATPSPPSTSTSPDVPSTSLVVSIEAESSHTSKDSSFMIDIPTAPAAQPTFDLVHHMALPKETGERATEMRRKLVTEREEIASASIELSSVSSEVLEDVWSAQQSQAQPATTGSEPQAVPSLPLPIIAAVGAVMLVLVAVAVIVVVKKSKRTASLQDRDAEFSHGSMSDDENSRYGRYVTEKPQEGVVFTTHRFDDRQ